MRGDGGGGGGGDLFHIKAKLITVGVAGCGCEVNQNLDGFISLSSLEIKKSATLQELQNKSHLPYSLSLILSL